LCKRPFGRQQQACAGGLHNSLAVGNFYERAAADGAAACTGVISRRRAVRLLALDAARRERQFIVYAPGINTHTHTHTQKSQPVGERWGGWWVGGCSALALSRSLRCVCN